MIHFIFLDVTEISYNNERDLKKRRNILERVSTSDSDYSYNSEKRNNKKKKSKKKDTKKNKKNKKNKKVQKHKVAVEKNVTQHTFVKPLISSDDDSISEGEKIIAVLPMNRNSLKPINIEQNSEESTGEKRFKRNEEPESSVFNNSLNNDCYKNNAILYNKNNNVLKLDTAHNTTMKFDTNSIQSYIKSIPLMRTPSINLVPLLKYEPGQKFLPIEPSSKEEPIQTNHQKDNINISRFKLFLTIHF